MNITFGIFEWVNHFLDHFSIFNYEYMIAMTFRINNIACVQYQRLLSNVNS